MRLFAFLFCLFFILCVPCDAAKTRPEGSAHTEVALQPADLWQDIARVIRHSDRSAGSAGAENVIGYVESVFRELDYPVMGHQYFFLPVPDSSYAFLEVEGVRYPIRPWMPNLSYLSTAGKNGIRGPCVYAGRGEWEDLKGLKLEGAIVFLELEVPDAWIYAAMFGAKAVVYLGREGYPSGTYRATYSSAPVAFPRFWLAPEDAQVVRNLLSSEKALHGHIVARTAWQNTVLRNFYAIIPGRNPELKEELVILEARYDSTAYIPGVSPGVDEATSMLLLLQLAREFARNPPERSVMFLFTSRGNRELAGMREFVWAITTSSKNLRRERRYLRDEIKLTKKRIEALEAVVSAIEKLDFKELAKDINLDSLIWPLVVDKAKDRADDLIRELSHSEKKREDLSGLQSFYRRLSWKGSFQEIVDLSDEEKKLVASILLSIAHQLPEYLQELKKRELVIKSAISVRGEVKSYEPVLLVSLDLSTASPYVQLQERGSSYPFRSDITKLSRSGHLVKLLTALSRTVSETYGIENLFLSPYWAEDTAEGAPFTCLCCDVATLGGLPAYGLTSDLGEPPLWGTPDDTWENWHVVNFVRLKAFMLPFFRKLTDMPGLSSACKTGLEAIASLEGTARFIRYGELFPDRPAPAVVVTAMQGANLFRSMVFMDGTFSLHGVANKKAAYQKLILEPYGFDPETGRIRWAADKRETGKSQYRVKIKGSTAYTSLVMFPCEQTDIFGLFHPRKLAYVTKVRLLDVKTDATPMKYWYSRIDGRDTILMTVLLEPGTRFKLVLSDSLTTRDVLFLNADEKHPMGRGFLIGDPGRIIFGPLVSVRDMAALVGHRLKNLRDTGIRNAFLERSYEEGLKYLNGAEKGLLSGDYGIAWEKTVRAWGYFNKIYGDIDSTQRDVLFGVIFFIILFVPFAYCMERYLFCHTGIYRQIFTFSIILLLTIWIIKSVHPAFRITYSPTMVIVAFFIVGLSLLVGYLIVDRFEHEIETQKKAAWRASGAKAIGQIKASQALTSGFAIGVSNLHRRRLRTALTCITLIILTFAIMSFTSVKTFQRVTDTKVGENPSYQGLEVHHPFWMPMSDFALRQIKALYHDTIVFPRAWIGRSGGSYDRTVSVISSPDGKRVGLEGVMGVGVRPPKALVQSLVWGRWIGEGAIREAVISVYLAEKLGIPVGDRGKSGRRRHHAFGRGFHGPDSAMFPRVKINGLDFAVVGIFDEDIVKSLKGLDGKPLLPAYLEIHPEEELTEVEVEAIEAGEEILPEAQRFSFASAERTVFIPFWTCLRMGGSIMAVHVLTEKNNSHDGASAEERLGTWYLYPVYLGKNEGVFFHSSSSALRYQGMSNVIIPVGVVLLICINTLIGQVHERRREISVYTSVGLAPHYVGFLFMMEAMAYAVLSCVIGYLLAQFVARYLGGTAMFASLTFNYSSLVSVVSMVLVFGVVFLASLYPARVAVNMSMPDVERSWKLPEPQNGVLVVDIPFLFPEEEHEKIVRYLAAFFNLHQDVPHGVFMSDGVRIDWAQWDEIHEGRSIPGVSMCLLLQTTVWLAPFDFGMRQRVHVYCCPDPDEPGYVHVTLRIVRLSGEARAWYRANKRFVAAVRKELLRWHTLDPAAKEEVGLGTVR
ncbi:FtsX-like permease family protein [Thermodesulforhabdus norvegica]|uniref:MacB-like core domain-containing protein n=1 Tax=Thermodesulforhabdus norvegica TaxID=39841 RepID=A0A1I4T8E8_9BACT|nr:FtsX-like permease family protein [Thermodesulforhabdus norvegica]SFM72925.1 MacB-like core domain-containing protein [Thermodesulforhabdus norvegica]